MAFTEFCCRSGGSNLNAGTRLGDSTEPGTAAALTYAGGGYVQSTRVFTVASGDPVADGVVADDYVALDTGGATAAYIARVTARTSTTITLSATGAGSNPADGTYTLRVGGAWKGPNAAEDWPFDQNTLANLANAATSPVRINFKNDADYSITATILPMSNADHITVEGYTTSYGDGGMATIDGGTSGASYKLISFSNAGRWQFLYFEFQNNGATGSEDGISWDTGGAAAHNNFFRCVVHDVRGSGWGSTSGAAPNYVEECEAYACNQSNTAGKSGFDADTCIYIRCISHDNTGSNTDGFGAIATYLWCIADSNGRDGFNLPASSTVIGCDSYNNGGDGLELADPGGAFSSYLIENCNFVKNGGFGIRFGTSNPGNIRVVQLNCGFGAGTQANTSGETNIAAAHPFVVIGSVTYAADVTPWVDPANGDFRITLTAAKGAGRGAWVQTAASYAGTVSYPDIGAAQHQDSGGAYYQLGIV